MNPLLKSLIGSILRKALTALSAYLVARRALTDKESAEMVEMAFNYGMDCLPLIASTAWSYWDQYNSRKVLVTALTQPVGTTENDVKAIIKSGAVTPTVNTPPNTVPGIPDETKTPPTP